MLTRRLAEEESRLCQSKGRSQLEDELEDHLDRVVRKNITQSLSSTFQNGKDCSLVTALRHEHITTRNPS